MYIERPDLGAIVRVDKTGEIGIVVPDFMNTCGPDEEPVVFDGSDAFRGTNRAEIEVIGQYDKHIDNPKQCGVGLGEFCCRYLTVTQEGAQCERFSSLRNNLKLRRGRAEGTPRSLMPPNCQDDIQLAAIEDQFCD